MTLSEISIRRPVFAWMLMAALIIFGLISFFRMGISSLPDVDFPVISVNLSLPGAAPEVLETDVIDVVENAVMTIQGVRSVTSTARSGRANVTIELELNRNIDVALQEVQTNVLEAQRKLPKDLEPPVIRKSNPEDHPILWLTVESDQYPLKDLMAYVRDRIQNHFSTVPDVGDINLGGYIEPNLRVWLSPEQLKRYQLTATDVINTIQNEHSELPAGWINENQKEFNVRTLGEAQSVSDFGKLVINSRGGAPNFSPIFLRQIARIEEGLDDVRRISRALGKPAVGLGIRKQRGSNAVKVAQAVQVKVEKLQKTLPPSMHLGVNFDITTFIKQSVGELNLTLVLSAILTSLVCWIFLGSWSSTLNILLAIPTSIIGTFIVLHFAGFTLNTFTLLALTLAIGIVVDDAIMVLENIVRHREKGMSRQEAALVGSKEITFAAVASTISIAAIFIPVAFMKGVIGKFFFQFGVTMTVAVFLSLLEAITLTPMRCAQFVEPGERKTPFGKFVEKSIRGFTRGYRSSLEVALNHRWKILCGSVVFFGASLFVFKLLNKEFVPAEDQGRFMVRIQTPIGSAIEFTNSKFQQIEGFLAQRKEVDRYYIAIGGFGGSDVNGGIVFITMKEKGQRGHEPKLRREPTQQDFMATCRAAFNQIPDVKAAIQDLSMRGFSSSRGFPVELTIRGPDWEKLGEYSQNIVQALQQTGLVTDVDSNYYTGMPEIQVVPDRVRAAQRGVSITAIGQAINAQIGGVVVGRYPKGGHRYDIRVKMIDDGASRQQKIERLFVRNNRGEIIPLSEVVRIVEKPSLMSIARMDRERAITVFGNVAKGKSQQKALEESERVAKNILPDGYYVTLTGSAETFKESFSSLLLALILG
ncbi:MAG: efflux RND transporter permease subunit, partial [Deltaproteobacteria bacterium]|nr:efflux RND transporter permease subunit [Deltaproteobacteria bacterium]